MSTAEIDVTAGRAATEKLTIAQAVRDAMRDEILSKYGSIDNYVSEGLGLSENEILKLRNRLVE